MRLLYFHFLAVSGALVLMGAGQPVQAQSGNFVIPIIRPDTHADGGTDFAFWDLFKRRPGSTSDQNYNYGNPPAALNGQGRDADNNATTAFSDQTTLTQVGTDTAFITSSGGIYSHQDLTTFEVNYDAKFDSTGEITNVIFQTKVAGTQLDNNSMVILYESGGQTHSIAPLFRAQDDPQTGNFTEWTITAFQWNLTGLGIRNFKIAFAAGGISMSLAQAQMDVVVGVPFSQQLGYLLQHRWRPSVRFGRPGFIDVTLAPGLDERFIMPGTSLSLQSIPENNWTRVGYVRDNVVSTTSPMTFTMPANDIIITALFAPTTYAAWRTKTFFHENTIIGTENDFEDDAISAPDIDHDHDGMDNFLEYAFGCDPYTPDAARGVQPMSTMVDGLQTYPCITYRTNGVPQGQATVVYRVQLSTDLSTWVDNTGTPGTTVEVSRVVQPDGTVLVTERAAQPITTFNRCFMQVVAE